MFAATQQIASVAGLKATKVQVSARRSSIVPSHRSRWIEDERNTKTHPHKKGFREENDIFDQSLLTRYLRTFSRAIRICIA